jgi:glycosyltransferase involved in cell wall biosynthesis
VRPESRYRTGVDDLFDDGLLPQLRRLQRKFLFDIVIVEYVFMSRAFEAFPPDVLRVIDTHDVFTDRHKHFLSLGLAPSWHSISRRDEARALRRADVAIAIQDRERSFLAEISGANVVTIGHFLKTDSLYKHRRSNNQLLMVGSANQVNFESFERFLKRVWPLVVDEMPEVRLLIAGAVCDKLCDYPSVHKMGQVDDLDSLYSACDAVVAPVYMGTGLNIKVVEALGYGMPVVTTEVGAKGIERCDALVVAQSDKEYAAAICELCSEDDKRANLSRVATAFAREWNRRQVDALRSALASPSSTKLMDMTQP